MLPRGALVGISPVSSLVAPLAGPRSSLLVGKQSRDGGNVLFPASGLFSLSALSTRRLLPLPVAAAWPNKPGGTYLGLRRSDLDEPRLYRIEHAIP